MLCPNPECPDRLATGQPGEYTDAVSLCPYCGTPLVPVLPSSGGIEGQDGPSPGDFEEVLQTADPVEATIVRSILDGADVPYLVEGQDRFEAYRAGHAGLPLRRQSGVLTFLVPADRVEEARALLSRDEPEDVPWLED